MNKNITLVKRLVENIILQELSDPAKKKALEKFKKENPNLTDNQINYYINAFEKYSSNKNIFPKTDLMQYKFSELEQIVDKNFSKEKLTGGDKIEYKGGEDELYNKNNLLILLGDLKQKCISYGSGYKWCISRTDSSNMFYSYRMRLNEPVFYFVFDKDKPKEDKYHAIVIYINKQKQYYVANANNEGDKQMSWDQIVEIQPKLKDLQSIFKHIPLKPEEREEYNKFKEPISFEEYEKLSYDQKNKYISFGHDLSYNQVEITPKELLIKYAKTTIGNNLPEDFVKKMSPSDQKELKNNRIEEYGELKSKFIYYQNDLTPEDLTVKGSLNLSNTPITSLPNNLIVGGDLNLNDTKITSLPNNLIVGGYLNLNDTKITSLPNNLKVGGDLVLNNTPITSLPDNLTVEGGLYLYHTPITSLPDNLTVGESLYLSNTKITSLPNNLKVGGHLNLSDTPITSLPDNLKVGGFLDLSGTPITSLPDNLKVGESLFLGNTPLSKKYTKDEIRKMIEDKGGYSLGGIMFM